MYQIVCFHIARAVGRTGPKSGKKSDILFFKSRDEFLGWYTEDGELISETSLVAFNEDITLYANWEDLNATELNPFAFIGKFFESIGNILRLVVQFLENMFSGTGNDALEQIK